MPEDWKRQAAIYRDRARERRRALAAAEAECATLDAKIAALTRVKDNWHASAVADRQRADRLLEALHEIHEHDCGCGSPGEFGLCAAKPTAAFAVLAAQSSEGAGNREHLSSAEAAACPDPEETDPLATVREALAYIAADPRLPNRLERIAREALDALDGCVILSREDAAEVKRLLDPKRTGFRLATRLLAARIEEAK